MLKPKNLKQHWKDSAVGNGELVDDEASVKVERMKKVTQGFELSLTSIKTICISYGNTQKSGLNFSAEVGKRLIEAQVILISYAKYSKKTAHQMP